jgi:hypothetical protein
MRNGIRQNRNKFCSQARSSIGPFRNAQQVRKQSTPPARSATWRIRPITLSPGPTQYAFVTASTPGGDVTFDAIPSSGNIEFLGNNNFPSLGRTLEAIRDYFYETGIRIGMKPAGGIRTAKQALAYLVMVKETLGDDG